MAKLFLWQIENCIKYSFSSYMRKVLNTFQKPARQYIKRRKKEEGFLKTYNFFALASIKLWKIFQQL